MGKETFCFSIIALISNISTASSQVIDLDKITLEILNSRGNPTNETFQEFRNIMSVFANPPDGVTKWEVENISARALDIKTISLKRSEFPLEIARDTRVLRNCTTRAQPSSETINLSFSLASNTSMSRAVTSTKTNNFTLSIPKTGISTQMNENEVINLTNNTSQTQTKIVNESTQINLSIPPKTITTITAVKTSYLDYINFEARVLFDADVFSIVNLAGSDNNFKESEGKLSDLIPDETLRSVFVSGQIENVTGRDLDVSYVEQDADIDNPHHCPQPSWLLSSPDPHNIEDPTQDNENDVISENSQNMSETLNNLSNTEPERHSNTLATSLIKNIPIINEDLFNYISSINSNDISQQRNVVVPYFNGINLTTSNSVANVEVRAQSLGPGFCATTFYGPSGPVALLAPPLFWSDWFTVFSHLNETNFSITNDVGCDTGIIAEVSYRSD